MSRKSLLVGKAFPRIEGTAKVTGQSHYINDLSFDPGLLFASLVVSRRPHARLQAIDSKDALQMAGVQAVFTGEDVAGYNGAHLRDRPILAREKVRYVGEPIAIVIAETADIAQAAAQLVRVSYKDLPLLDTITSSLAEDAPLIHPDFSTYVGADLLQERPHGNHCARFSLQHGDMKAGWAEADVILEREYHTVLRQHVPLETHGAIAYQDSDGLIRLWSSAITPYALRTEISHALHIPPERLRVSSTCVGGGVGTKSRASIETAVVAAAMHIPEHPIKLVLPRDIEFISTFVRPALTAYLKMGVTSAGEIVALQARYQWDVGASGDACLATIWASTYAGTGPYRIPHCEIISEGVYTNHTPASPMRGNDVAEIHWAIEQMVDELAATIGMDPFTFRLQNILKGGDDLAAGVPMHAMGLEPCLQAVSEALPWQPDRVSSLPENKKRGQGLAVFWNPATQMADQVAEALLHLDNDGFCTIFIDTVDGGQGIRTFVAQLAASELGIPLDWVHIEPADTASELYTNEDRLGCDIACIGNAVLEGARQLKKQIVAYVTPIWEEDPRHVDIIDGVIISHATERTLPLDEFLIEGIDTPAGKKKPSVFVARGRYFSHPLLATDNTSMLAEIQHFCVGAIATEVEVDTVTGEVQVLKLAAALDVGHAINPALVLSQIKGGAIQGLSAALLETLVYENGVPKNTNLHDYVIATFADLPSQLHAAVIQVPQDSCPYGARSIGADVPLIVAPAIANAIYHATGGRLTTQPITPERVWRVLAPTQKEEA